MYGDFSELNEIIAGLGIVVNILGLVFYVLKAWGLYMINSKLGEDHAWLSWVPVINIYMWAKAGNKSFLTYVIYPFIALFIGGLLGIFTFGLSILAAVIYFIWAWIQVCGGISERTGRGGWSTAGLFFVPAAMLPIIGYKLEEKKSEK